MGVLRKPVISGNHGDFIGFFVPKKLGEFRLFWKKMSTVGTKKAQFIGAFNWIFSPSELPLLPRVITGLQVCLVLGIVPKGIFSAIISTLQILYYVV